MLDVFNCVLRNHTTEQRVRIRQLALNDYRYLFYKESQAQISLSLRWILRLQKHQYFGYIINIYLWTYF